MFDICGMRRKPVNTAGMLVPVRCNFCSQVYDLTKGKPIQRYADCTVFTTPCCNRRADDRSWKSLPDFERL